VKLGYASELGCPLVLLSFHRDNVQLAALLGDEHSDAMWAGGASVNIGVKLHRGSFDSLRSRFPPAMKLDL